MKRTEDIERAAWPVTFESTPLDASALKPGDFVTVMLRDEKDPVTVD